MEEKKFVTILGSCSKNAKPKYIEAAKEVASLLSSDEYGYNLVFGGASFGPTGAVYDEFAKNNRDIYLVTTEKYADDAKNMPNAKLRMCETTFDLKKELFEKSDFIVVLDAGIGTLSEFLSSIEEIRSNNQSKYIEAYSVSDLSIMIRDLFIAFESEGLADDSVHKDYNISNNINEFKEHIDAYLNKEESKKYEK